MSLDFSVKYFLPTVPWPWGRLSPLVKMSTRNIPERKGGRCVRLTNSPHLCAECHENLGTKISWNPLGHTGPVTGMLYLFYHVWFVSERSLVETPIGDKFSWISSVILLSLLAQILGYNFTLDHGRFRRFFSTLFLIRHWAGIAKYQVRFETIFWPNAKMNLGSASTGCP
jgi:hypothetical protein